ncbi:MAG TPA: NUDIX domain-containing protein [Acidimicrobiales bacterium]|nr:NUDIX domain-containing protein [Acidimicrobiales bacterium]
MATRDRRDAARPGADAGTDADADADAGDVTGATVRRVVARVLLVDDDGAVLLLSGRDPDTPSAPEFWYTPGGGAEPGESLEEAGRREVLEETGHRTGDLGTVRWRRETSFAFAGFVFDQDESYFVVRTSRFEVRPMAWTELERRSTTGWRWWPRDELRETDAVVHPPELPDLLTALEAGRLPEPPAGP